MRSFEQRKQAAIHFRKEIERQMNEALQGFASWLEADGRKLEFPLDIDRLIEHYLGMGLYICRIQDEFPAGEAENLRDVRGALRYRPDSGGWMV